MHGKSFTPRSLGAEMSRISLVTKPSQPPSDQPHPQFADPRPHEPTGHSGPGPPQPSTARLRKNPPGWAVMP
jgi:hypothetical protein